MAKNMKRMMALLLVVMFCFSTFATPAKAMGNAPGKDGFSYEGDRNKPDMNVPTEGETTEGETTEGETTEGETTEGETTEGETTEGETTEGETTEGETTEGETTEGETTETKENRKEKEKEKENNDNSTYKEYIVINVNGSHLKTISGNAGDDTWLVQGTYTESFSMSGNVLSYTVGKQSGTVTIPMPSGFEDCTISDVSITCSWGGGTNSQSEKYDNAIINVTFTKVQTPGGDIVDITDPTDPDPTDPDPVDYEPVLKVEKKAAKATYKVGETITWTITVTNTSAFTAYDVVITDDLTNDRWTIATLAAGGAVSFTATLENAPAGKVKNVVVTTWTDGDEIPDNEEPEETKKTSDDEIVDVEKPDNYAPVLKIEKTANKASYKVGETITWTITVTNTSTYTAYDVAITDELTGDNWSIASLAPGASQTFTATLENAPAGKVKNVVVTTWTDNDEIPDNEEPEETKKTSDEEIVDVEEPVNYTPVLKIEKTADKAVYEAGETINWTITVTNTSTYTAYDVAITDELTGDSWSIASLAPGASQSFDAVTENAASGSVKNVAVVTWTDNDEIPDSEEPNEIKKTSDDEIVSVNDPAPENHTPVLEVIKTAEQKTYKAGDSINFKITVKNVSEYTAYNVVIVDELAKGYWTIPSLAPGAEQSFEAVLENVAAGSVKNVVVVNWEDGDEIPDEDEPNEITETEDDEIVVVEELKDFAPVLRITKTANKATYQVGQTIKWTIVVENISEYTAYDVIVVDELTGDEWNIEALEPGAQKTFTTSTKNAKAGNVKNVAEVSWTDGDEIPDSEEPDEVRTDSDDEIVVVKKNEVPNVPEEDEPVEENEPVVVNDEIEIEDEEVPLGAAPKTGDISALWIAMSGLSASGLILLGKKRKDEE